MKRVKEQGKPTKTITFSLSNPLTIRMSNDIICARSYQQPQDAQEVQKERNETMTEQALEARRAYRREWAKRNPDKVKATQERYWAKKAAQAAADQEAREEEKEK